MTTKIVTNVLLGLIVILLSILLIVYKTTDSSTELQQYSDSDTTVLIRLDAIELKQDCIIQYDKRQQHEISIKYIKIRDSLLNMPDSIKDIYITNYISNYKSIKLDIQ